MKFITDFSIAYHETSQIRKNILSISHCIITFINHQVTVLCIGASRIFVLSHSPFVPKACYHNSYDIIKGLVIWQFKLSSSVYSRIQPWLSLLSFHVDFRISLISPKEFSRTSKQHWIYEFGKTAIFMVVPESVTKV